MSIFYIKKPGPKTHLLCISEPGLKIYIISLRGCTACVPLSRPDLCTLTELSPATLSTGLQPAALPADLQLPQQINDLELFRSSIPKRL